jgi:hypothetical protein
VKFAASRWRGYLAMDVALDRARAGLRAMDSVAVRDAACRTLATFVVDDGTPGARPA